MLLKYYIYFILSILFVGVNSEIVNSIEISPIYDSPVHRSTTINVIINFEPLQVGTDASIKLSDSNGLMIYQSNNYSIPSNILQVVLNAQFFEANGTLKGPLPITISVEPGSSGRAFTNNQALLPYYSDYYGHEADSPSASMTLEKLQTSLKPPSGIGAGAKCTSLYQLSYQSPNYYQYYYYETGHSVIPIQRNSTFISFIIARIINSPYIGQDTSLQIDDLTPFSFQPTISTLNCQTSSFQTIDVLPLVLRSFSKSIIMIMGDNSISRITATCPGDSSTTDVNSPSSYYRNDKVINYFMIYKRMPQDIAFQLFINLNQVGTVDMTYPYQPISTNNLSALSFVFYKKFYLRGSLTSFPILQSNGRTGMSVVLQDVTYTDIQDIDFFVLFVGGVQASDPIRPTSKIATYQVPITISTYSETQIELRTFLRNNAFLSYKTPSNSFQQPELVYSVATVSSSIINSDYIISFSNLKPMEYPVVSTTVGINITQPLPVKIINSEFPFKFKGSSQSLQYSLRVPILSDTISKSTLLLNTPSLELQSFVVDNKVYDGFLDLLAPLADVVITYNQELPDGSFIDMIRVNVHDDIGIDSDRCSLSYGPYKFNLTPSNRVKGGVKGSSSFLFPFKLNRYFCDSLISFSCEDLRGNSVYWDSNLVSEISNNFISKTGDLSSCLTPLSGLKILSIDTTILGEGNGSPYSLLFAVTLQGSTNDLNSIVVEIYLDSQSPNNQDITTDLYIPLDAPPLAYGFNIFYNDPLEYSSDYGGDYKYRLKIVDTSDNDMLEFTNQELQYISDSQSGKDMVFQTSITLRTPSYSGFVNLFTSAYDNDLTITFRPFSVLDDIEYINISYISATLPLVQVHKIDINTSNEDIVDFRIPYKMMSQIWVSSMCDIHGNCENFNPSQYTYGMSSGIPSAPDFAASVIEQYFSRLDIDTTTQDRTFTYSFNISFGATLTQLSDYFNPILYIVEIESQNRISFPLTKITENQYQCNGELPLNWGVRGIESYHVYNVISNTGYFSGFDYYNDLPSTIPKQSNSPNIWSITLDISLPSPMIYIKGSLLGYLEDSLFTPKIKSQTGTISGTLSIELTDSTSGTIKLTKKTAETAKSLIIGTQEIDIDLQTCIDPTCSGHGTCQGTICQCHINWSGIDCSISTTYTCLNNCSGHGTCDFQICNCFTGYMGPSCSIQVTENNKNIDITINTDTESPTTSFITDGNLSKLSKETKFTIMLTKLEEIDFHGTVINSYDLILDSWSLVSSNSSSHFYSIPIGDFSTLTTVVTTTSDSPLSVQFANQTLQIPENSIKYYLKVENYTFESKVNHLEFTWVNLYKVPNACSTQKNITYGGLDKSDVHYIIIPANQLQLYGRFSNLIVVDNRTLLSSNSAQEQDDKVIVKINIPYFNEYAELDPDFSVLVDLNEATNQDDIQYDDECNIIESNSGTPKYILPVAVVVSVVGFALIFVSVVMLYKKNISFKLKILAIKKLISKDDSSAIKLSNF